MPKQQLSDDPANTPAPDDLTRFGLSPLELARVAPMPEAAHLSSVSEDSLLRNHSKKVLKLGPRRNGMRVLDALTIGEGRK